MRVYRIELKVLPINLSGSKQSLGPYWASNTERFGFKNIDNSEYENCWSNPTPEDDGLPIRSNLFYGFKSTEQMLDWFDLHLKALHEGGCHLVIYEVPEEYVHFGQKQLSFELEKAQVISFQSLMPIFHSYIRKHINDSIDTSDMFEDVKVLSNAIDNQIQMY